MAACTDCGDPINLTSLETSLLDEWGLPNPHKCPQHRAQERLAWRNERTLYRRTCSATGASIISIFHQQVPFPVFEQKYWWSDNWDALLFGREIDFKSPFFPQFVALFQVVPQCALRCPQSENCEYTNQCEKNKDCYLVFCSNNSRECLHGMWYQTCTNCVDCTYLEKSELCYEILNGKQCYGCTFSDNLQNCSDCHFSRDLIGCTSCFGSANLRNKQFCFFNRQLDKDTYRKKVHELRLDTFSALQVIRSQSESHLQKFPYKFYSGRNNEIFSGDYLENNKNVLHSYNCRNSENIIHCRDAWGARNSVDLTETLDQDFCIQLEGCYKNVGSGFSAKISESHDCWYCSHCFNSRDLFGCVGLRQKQYCILNRQYLKDDYFDLREKLVTHMRRTNEWGSYFPSRYSPFAYNESVAMEYFPLSEAEARSKGFHWNKATTGSTGNIPVTDLPDSIHDVESRHLNSVISCQQTGRGYQIQSAEFDLLKRLTIPLPRLHPDVRHELRMHRRNKRKLYESACNKCSVRFDTTFDVRCAKQVLCEDCFGQAADQLL